MKKGFTVVEILVVIGIIAVLTVIILPSLSNIRAKNRDAEKVADIAAIQLGLSLYKNQSTNGTYPRDLNTLAINSKYITSDSLQSPVAEHPYIYVPLTRDDAGTPNSKCTSYHLGVQLELPSAQIDATDEFSTADFSDISNGYFYCGTPPLGTTGGIDPEADNMYQVHP